MDVYKGLFVLTKQDGLQKVTPADKVKSVDESKLYKVTTQAGSSAKGGPVRLLAATKEEIEEIKKQNRLLTGRFSNIAPKPSLFAIKNSKGVTVTTLPMTTPTTHKPVTVMASETWPSEKRTVRRSRGVANKGQSGRAAHQQVPPSGSTSRPKVEVMKTSVDRLSAVNPMASFPSHVNTQMTQNIVTGRLSHLTPSFTGTTNNVNIPKPMFVIRPTLNTNLTSSSSSLGNLSNLQQFPISSTSATQRTTIRLVPSASTGQPVIYPAGQAGNTGTFTIPGPFAPPPGFQSVSGSTQNITFSGENGALVPGKPIRVIFPTQPTTMPNSLPVIYSSDFSSAKGHTTKVVLRPVAPQTKISPSQLGRTVAAASSFQQIPQPVTSTVSSSWYKKKPEKDTTMDLKIGSVFSLADATALWDDDKSAEKVSSEQKKKRKEDVLEISDDDAGSVDSPSAEVETEDVEIKEKTATLVKENELAGDQMQVSIAQIAAQQMSGLCTIKNKKEVEDGVIHIIGSGDVDDEYDSMSESDDENFYPELGDKWSSTQLPKKRKPLLPTKACNVESALFPVLDELKRKRNQKREKVAKLKVEKQHVPKDPTNELSKHTLKLTPEANVTDKDLPVGMKSDDDTNVANEANDTNNSELGAQCPSAAPETSGSETIDALDNKPVADTTNCEEIEEETDDVVTLEPELNELIDESATGHNTYPELVKERGTYLNLIASALSIKESTNKRRKQLCPEQFVPNSVLQAKRLESRSTTSGPEQDVPSHLAKTSFRIQDPKPLSSPRDYGAGRIHTPVRSQSPPVLCETTDTTDSQTQAQPTKQIRIITIPTDKSSGQIRVKNCLSIKPNTASPQNVPFQKVSPKPTTQGFLRIVKGGQVQLVPIRITQGAKGMVLTPVEGELATDETGLKPLPKVDKYRDIPRFGPSIEHFCIGVCHKKEISDALGKTPLTEEDIADFEKVFIGEDKKVSQTEFVNLVRQRPVFQGLHDSMFDIRPWTKEVERAVCNFYRCRKCSIKLDKLTLSATQTVKLRKVLQAQLYCGIDYDSDSSEDEGLLVPDLGEEVSVCAIGQNISIDDADDDEISSIIAQADREHCKIRYTQIYVVSNSHDTTAPSLRPAQYFRTNGFINETVDPFDDHNYFNEDNDVLEGFADDDIDIAPEGVDSNDLDADLIESQEVQQCLNDLIDDAAPGYGDKTDEREEESDSIQENTEMDTPEDSDEEYFHKSANNDIPEDADICQSIMLDCMDFETDMNPHTDTLEERSLSPVSEGAQSDHLETVSLGSDDDTSVDEDEPAQVEDAVVVNVEPAQFDESCAAWNKSVKKEGDDEFRASNIESQDVIDLEMDELPVTHPIHDTNTSSHRTISPIVIAPISDEEYGFGDETGELSQIMPDDPVTIISVNDQFNYIKDNVVGEVNIKSEFVNSNTDIPLNNDFFRQNNEQSIAIESIDDQRQFIQEGTALDADIEASGGAKSTKAPKKKKRRSSSETSECKETFKIKLPEDYRHIPIMHCYSLLPEGVRFAKREKRPKKHSEGKTSGTGTRFPKVRRIQAGVPSAPEAKDGKAVSLLKQQHQGVMLKIQDKPTFFFRVSADNKLINFGDLNKVSNEAVPQGTSTGKNLVPIAPSQGGVSLLKSQNPSSTASVVPPASSSAAPVPSMASISADSVSKLTSLLKSRSGVAVSSSPGVPPETVPTVSKLASSTDAGMSASPGSKSQMSLIKSPLKKNEVQKDKEQKLMSLLKPLQLQTGTKIKLKKVSAGGDTKDSPEKNQSSQKNTKSFQVKFVNGQATIIPKENDTVTGGDNVFKGEVSGQGDSKKVGGESDDDNAVKRKLETDDDNELDPKKVKFDPKDDRIRKLKEQLRVQEEELEKIKKSREATKTLLSLYESDT